MQWAAVRMCLLEIKEPPHTQAVKDETWLDETFFPFSSINGTSYLVGLRIQPVMPQPHHPRPLAGAGITSIKYFATIPSRPESRSEATIGIRVLSPRFATRGYNRGVWFFWTTRATAEQDGRMYLKDTLSWIFVHCSFSLFNQRPETKMLASKAAAWCACTWLKRETSTGWSFFATPRLD